MRRAAFALVGSLLLSAGVVQAASGQSSDSKQGPVGTSDKVTVAADKASVPADKASVPAEKTSVPVDKPSIFLEKPGTLAGKDATTNLTKALTPVALSGGPVVKVAPGGLPGQ